MIKNISELITRKRLDLDLVEKNYKTKAIYSNEWQYIKNRVNELSENIIAELIKDVLKIKETEQRTQKRLERIIEVIDYKGKEYPISIIAYESNDIIIRAYYVAFNKYENISYIREIIGKFESKNEKK